LMTCASDGAANIRTKQILPNNIHRSLFFIFLLLSG
jgi:hypothetical protein